MVSDCSGGQLDAANFGYARFKVSDGLLFLQAQNKYFRERFHWSIPSVLGVSGNLDNAIFRCLDQRGLPPETCIHDELGGTACIILVTVYRETRVVEFRVFPIAQIIESRVKEVLTEYVKMLS